MPLTDPGTRSDYKLILQYRHFDVQHQAGLNIVGDYGVPTVVGLTPTAENLRDLVQACLPSSHVIQGWAIQQHDGTSLAEVTFDADYPGGHGAAIGQADNYSASINILGKGVPSVLGTAMGRTSLRLFTGEAYLMAVGRRYLSTAPDVALAALMDYLNTNPVVFADFYGQKAATTGDVAIQYHGAIQRRYGS